MAKDQVQITFKVFNEEYKKAMSEMRESTTRLNREFRLQKEQMKLTGSETDKLKGQIGYLNERYKQAQDRVKATENQLEKTKRTFGESSDEVKKLEGQLTNAQIQEQRFANELETTNKQLKEAESKTLKMSKALSEAGSNMQDVGKKVSDAGKKMTVGVTTPIVGLGTAAVKSSIDFESSFAGVLKTMDLTTGQADKMKIGIRDMAKEIPASATAIAEVAESAGQLGIETDNVLGFTRVMIDLGESTNMSADTAATSLARLANITGMSQSDFDRLGSSIVDLGNNLATTESEIVEMGLRLAGAGNQVGMSEAQIMGFAGALSSVGIEAQAGGSAFSKVMVDMQLAVETGSGKLEDFAKVAGMSSKDFQKAFKEDAAGAIVAFVKGLGDSEKQGKSAIKILDDMEIKEVRLRDALLRAAGASDVFTKAVDISSEAWGENTALTEEANQRYETTESRLQILKNRYKDVSMELGDKLIPFMDKGIDMLQGWADKLDDLSPAQMDNIIKIGGAVAAIGPLLLVGGKLTGMVGGLITGIGTVSGAIGVMTTGAAASTPAIGGLATVFTALTGPVGIAAAALAGVAVGGMALAHHLKKDSIPAVDLFGDGVSSATEKAVGGFLDLNDQATLALKELSWSGSEVTAEMVENITGSFNQMKEQIVTSLDEQHNESLEKMQTFMANAQELTDEEQQQTLASMQEGHEAKKQAIEEGEAQIKEIIETASAEKRGITQAEQEEINAIQQNMVETGIQTLSESEVESKLIMERMKESAGEMSALQAAEVVKNSKEQRDGAVAAAEEQYDDVVKEIIKMRDESGTISAEQADKLIEEAQRQRDESVASANQMHMDVITEAKAQAGEHVDQVDWSTGEIKSKWDILWENTKTTFKGIGRDISEVWSDAYQDTSSKWADMQREIEKHGGGMRGFIRTLNDKNKEVFRTTWGEIGRRTSSTLSDMLKTTGEKMTDIKSKIANSKLADAWNKVWNFQLPKIKLPHLSVTGSFSIIPPRAPEFHVIWKSQGAIFKRPTVLNGIGVGDASRGVGSNPEVVAPLTDLLGMIKDTVQPIQEAQPSYATVINFNGNYTFNDRDDIDYMLNQAELKAKRREY